MIIAIKIITTLLISAYAPSLGGLNCDGDCSVMASGNVPYEGALACPIWMPLGTIIELSHSPIGPMVGVCEDRGGLITENKVDFCLTEGDVATRAKTWGRRSVSAIVKYRDLLTPIDTSGWRHQPI